MPRTPDKRRLSSQNSSLTATPPPPMQHSNNNSTTVTMMLANRIIHPGEWSVDDEHFFEANTMNVWQTLEFLSSLNLRKRYHYEGYSDTENILRTLTPSWRRDSFAEKAATNREEGGDGSGSGSGRGKMPLEHVGARLADDGAAAMRRDQHGSNNKSNRKKSGAAGKVRFVRNKCGNSKQQRRRTKSETLDPEYVLLPAEYNDLVKCKYEKIENLLALKLEIKKII